MNRNGYLYRGISELSAFLRSDTKWQDPTPLNLPFSSSLSTELPGWQWFNPSHVNAEFGGAGLTLTALQESVWWMNDRAASYYSHVQGNVDVSVRVNTRSSSKPGRAPDSEYQLAGIMLRDPNCNQSFALESYLFNLVGYRGNSLQVESKTTHRGRSEVTGQLWPSGDADLRIVRKDANFSLFARESEQQEWTQVNHFVRHNLPEVLEVALIAYSFSYGKNVVDLSAQFKNLVIQ